MADYRYLVFAGGGAAGIAYAGAIKQLGQEADFSLDKIVGVAGASVGAIAGLMIAMNYTPQEASDKLGSLNLSSLADGGCVLAEGYHLFSRYGIYKGEALHKFIISIISEKIKDISPKIDPKNFTFGDLKKYGFKDFHVVTSKIQLVNGTPSGSLKHFCYDTHPDTPIAAVTHASAAAPFFFERVRLKKVAKGKYIPHSDGDIFGDGGLLNDFPIDIFDKPQYIPVEEKGNVVDVINPHTLGLAVRDKSQIIDKTSKPVKARIGDNNPITAFEGVANSFLKNFIAEGLNKDYNIKRTIEINQLGVSPFNFSLGSQMQSKLVASGTQAVKEYFHPELKAVNANEVRDNPVVALRR